MTRIHAIVPAAGRSRRMGGPAKQLLPVSGGSMLRAVVDALLPGGATNAAVVVTSDLKAALSDLPEAVELVINDAPASEMIDSIRFGLRTQASQLQRQTLNDGYLICPCDAAGLTAADVRRCCDAFIETPDRIIIAAHAGRRGHPIIFPAALASAVLSSECDTGLNQLHRNRPHLVRMIECSPGAVSNINTPDDYEPVKQRAEI